MNLVNKCIGKQQTVFFFEHVFTGALGTQLMPTQPENKARLKFLVDFSHFAPDSDWPADTHAHSLHKLLRKPKPGPPNTLGVVVAQEEARTLLLLVRVASWRTTTAPRGCVRICTAGEVGRTPRGSLQSP